MIRAALRLLASQGAATQAVAPGVYVWAVTVAPVGFGSGSTLPAHAAAVLGLLAVLVAPLVERTRPGAARLFAGWGLVAGAIATWALGPESRLRAFDAVRGIAGLLGWALFTLALASPAVSRAKSLEEGGSPSPAVSWDSVVAAVGVILGLSLQLPGWSIVDRDRSLLLRVLALAGSLALISASCAIGVAIVRYRETKPSKKRRDAALLWTILAVLLGGGGAAFEVWGPR